ncbi:DUF1090 domain-containing protein [Bartonella tamiae]|uniref:Protein yqjC n=1 Tax=Bartonella tamiae Th239 TaxID=1094558 RepID=J0ZK08_9HYPH|nr:DUF1090 domain-containing protein [Bartonella tamiae]EJF88663.1 hypothetical protein ME5_01214 [Bartonella tamiae Th239]EJF95087.1 hypothetical protein MEG_00668 [Bartonella tamiae Th307]
MIKKILLSGVMVLALGHVASAQPALKGCAAKQKDIQTQLDYARKYNNKYEISGLEKALKENMRHCTDAKLTEKRQEKVAEKRQKVLKREAELSEAKAKGNPKKIEKKIKKLNEAKRELDSAKANLDK